jgi:hypothetical protein
MTTRRRTTQDIFDRAKAVGRRVTEAFVKPPPSSEGAFCCGTLGCALGTQLIIAAAADKLPDGDAGADEKFLSDEYYSLSSEDGSCMSHMPCRRWCMVCARASHTWSGAD